MTDAILFGLLYGVFVAALGFAIPIVCLFAVHLWKAIKTHLFPQFAEIWKIETSYRRIRRVNKLAHRVAQQGKGGTISEDNCIQLLEAYKAEADALLEAMGDGTDRNG